MTDIRSDSKDAIREELRAAMSYQGPCAIPKKYLDEVNYVYYLELYDTQKPIKFQESLNLGYKKTKVEDLPNLMKEMADASVKFPFVDDAGFVAIKINPTQTHYLMEIPRQRWEIIQELKQEERDETVRRIVKKTKEQTVDDDLRLTGELKVNKGFK